MRRYAAKADSSQREIMSAIRKAGGFCWYVREPCDVLYWHQGRWGMIECKPPGKRRRKDQPEQDAFVAAFSVPICRSGDDALRAIGAIR